MTVHLQHVHARQMSSLLVMKAAMGLLALVLSGLLAFTFAAALLADETRVIGVMRAIGGNSLRIAGIYLAMMTFLGTLASLVAIPIATVIGRSHAALTLVALNFDLDGGGIPLWVVGAQLAAGVVVPVVGALVPAWRGTHTTVADALGDFGLVRPTPAGRLVDRLMPWLGAPSRPLLLSLRNMVRRPGRVAVTLVALATGGAIFVGALNLRGAISQLVDDLFRPVGYDLVVALREAYPRGDLERIISRLPGVTAVETGSRTQAAMVAGDGAGGETFPILAPPPGSRLVSHPLVEGRRLRPGDAGVLVVNRVWASRFPDVRLGDAIQLAVGGRRRAWEVVGIVDSASTGAVAFAELGDLANWLGETGQARTAMVRLDPSDEGLAAHVRLVNERLGGRSTGSGMPETFARLHGRAASSSPAGEFLSPDRVLADAPALMEVVLAGAGVEVASCASIRTLRAGLEDHMLLVVDFLLYTALLVLVVGGCALASTMILSVLERTREIGILRALGAPHRMILLLVLGEGLLFGALTWGIAVAASVPIGEVLGGVFGGIMFGRDVGFSVTPGSAGLWLLVVMVITVGACAWPALRAVRLTTARALADG